MANILFRDSSTKGLEVDDVYFASSPGRFRHSSVEALDDPAKGFDKAVVSAQFG
jgi:hypothetical protein